VAKEANIDKTVKHALRGGHDARKSKQSQ